MHEEATITTTAASSKIASNNIINNPHQSIAIDDNSIATTTTTTISIHHLHHHPNATVIENYASLPSSSSASNANLISQIVSPQTKIIINSVDDVVDDVSSVILNGAIANSNDPNVLIVGTSSTCDNDKNEITLNLQNADQQHMEIEIVEGAAASIMDDGSGGDGSEEGDGKFKVIFNFLNFYFYFFELMRDKKHFRSTCKIFIAS
jgi:hypothetical protein